MSGFELRVDARVHAREIERFWSKVVRGPGAACWVWTGAVGDDGYGSFSIRRPELDPVSGCPVVDEASGRPVMREHVVSAPRYALAAVHAVVVGSGVVAEHAVCDEPICVRVHPGTVEGGSSHVVISTQRENLATMGRRGRGGGLPRDGAHGPNRAAMAARSRAIREAVRAHGFDAARIAEAVAALAEDRGQLRLF
ncbi:MAG: hypothetical protein JXA67_22220 [Micromonosporaceae bacterium]|nr:hypothetical protein [Micromonosporaceae bacterium]